MNKSDLAELVSKKTETKKAGAELVDEIFSAMQETLKKGEKVQISGFGTFSVKQRKARVGRNPKTGEPAEIPAKNVVRFKASPELL